MSTQILKGLGDHRQRANAKGISGHFASVPTGVGEENTGIRLWELWIVVVQQARSAAAESFKELLVPVLSFAEGNHAVLKVARCQRPQTVWTIQLLRRELEVPIVTEFQLREVPNHRS
eukprot:Skav202330  [mRNA]  locus=scaffold60:420030:421636:- [translate_table: standard]